MGHSARTRNPYLRVCVGDRREKHSESDIVEAWAAFDAINDSEFWLDYHSGNASSVDDPINTIIAIGQNLWGRMNTTDNINSVKKIGGAVKPAIQLVALGAIAYGIHKHTTTPEYKENERKRKEQEKKVFVAIFGIFFVIFKKVL